IKGCYRLSAADLEARADWLKDVLVLLLPLRTWREPLDTVRVEHEARWLANLKPGASWMACELTRSTDDAVHLATLQSISDTTGLPLVATGDVQMHARRRKRLHDVLTAVRVKTPLAQCGRELAPNAERYLRPLYRLARIYPTDLLLQTQAIAERCTFSLDELRYEYPEEIVPPGETPATWLLRRGEDALPRRHAGEGACDRRA
ncbi:MAG: polymerase alpha subunit, partial [Burkholderiaceae bacterium]|nr:polymerase alpha subunit [Burkholderiaceae bacterium]